MKLLNNVLGLAVRGLLIMLFAFCMYRLFEGRMLWYLLGTLSLLGLFGLRGLKPQVRESES